MNDYYFVTLHHIINMSKKFISISLILLSVSLLPSCNSKKEVKEVSEVTEKANSSFSANVQGIWINDDTDSPFFMVRGDSVYYPDSTSISQSIKIQGDTLLLGNDSYKLESLSEYRLSFQSLTGETVSLTKSTSREDSLYFMVSHKHPVIYTEVTNRDTVTTFNGTRYHSYITINPSSNKVYKTSFNDEGVAVQNCYFDNVIHLSVYEGKQRLFGSNFTKDLFSSLIPEQFLNQATLSDIKFGHTDKNGFHFDATVCIPEGAACYMVDVTIGFDGDATYKLMDY